MGDKKEAKKKAKAEKKRLKKYAGTCPKCQHPAHEHNFGYSSYYSLMMFGGGTSSGCKADIEKPGDDGFIRVEACKCDLTPDEAQLNAEKSSGLKSFDKLMSSLNTTKG